MLPNKRRKKCQLFETKKEAQIKPKKKNIVLIKIQAAKPKQSLPSKAAPFNQKVN